MKIQESAENYLESVLILQKQKGHVRSIDIVNYLDFSKPSVSVAMKNLRENGYIHMDDGYITLTEKGMDIAKKVQQIFEETDKIYCSNLSEKEAEQLVVLLQKVENNISQNCK